MQIPCGFAARDNNAEATVPQSCSSGSIAELLALAQTARLPAAVEAHTLKRT
jgi:hypothetical protein